MEKLKNLLNHVSIIQKKYDDLAEYSGEHYNIFDILGIRNSELSHSAILTNLLNVKGKHGQKDKFLKLLIEQIIGKLEFIIKHNSEDMIKADGLKNRFSNFIATESSAVKEKHLGKVNYDNCEGGFIDIFISDNKNHIIIENKIHAGDQPTQLMRYANEYPNHPIIYLTLNGKEPSANSVRSKSAGTDLKINEDFITMSYADDLVPWLENCIKEVSNKPFIRETINQYLILIKSLTNQSNNNIMQEEILNIMNKNVGASFEIFNNLGNLKINLFLSFIEKLKNKFSEDVIIEVDAGIGGRDTAVSFQKESWNEKVKILLYFLGNNFSNVILGTYVNPQCFEQKIREKFEMTFKNIPLGKKEQPGNNWYILFKYENFLNINDSDFWVKLNDDNFVNTVYEDVKLIIDQTHIILEKNHITAENKY